MNEQLSLFVDVANSRLSRFPPLSNLNAAFMIIVKSEDLTSKIPTSLKSQTKCHNDCVVKLGNKGDKISSKKVSKQKQ